MNFKILFYFYHIQKKLRTELNSSYWKLKHLYYQKISGNYKNVFYAGSLNVNMTSAINLNSVSLWQSCGPLGFTFSDRD